MLYKTLSNGVEIPMLGFGTYKSVDGASTVEAVKTAIKNGYRHIDTAKFYQNEDSIGQAIKECGVPREELFITDKLWFDDMEEYKCREAFFTSLNNLGLDYLDLYLIHLPRIGFVEAWKEMEKLYEEGKVRAIGVSNFHPKHFDKLLKEAKIKPMVNQIEINPYFNNNELIEYCQNQDIIVEGWSPFAGNRLTDNILEDATILEIAEKYGKSPAQVILRWDLDRDVIAFPKSTTEKRIIQNFDVFDFELAQEDIDKINTLNRNIRSGIDPDSYEF